LIHTGFRQNSWATVWSVEPGKGNYSNVRLTISRKNRDTGAYEDEFSGFCMFIGDARAKAEHLKERDRIKLGDVDVTRRYDKEKNKEYYTFKVFSFEMANAAGGQSAPSQTQPQSRQDPADGYAAVDPGDGSGDDLPF